MRKSKVEKRLPEPQHSKEQKADVTSVSPAIAKPTVICSQSDNILCREMTDVEISEKNKLLKKRRFAKLLPIVKSVSNL